MKTADWKVLINSREFWDTQSRTACQPVFQSHEVEQRQLQTRQASPQCCPQVSTALYVELQGDPELGLCNSTAGPSPWWKERCRNSPWNPRLHCQYASKGQNYLWQLLLLSTAWARLTLQIPALRSHPLTNPDCSGSEHSCKNPSPSSPNSIHWFIDIFGNPRNYCCYQMCWKYSLFSFLLLLLCCCNKGSFTLQWSSHCCEQVTRTSGYRSILRNQSILRMKQHSLREHMGQRLPPAV